MLILGIRFGKEERLERKGIQKEHTQLGKEKKEDNSFYYFPI